MRIKALIALLGLVFGLMLIVGCDDDNDEDNTFTIGGTVTDSTGTPVGNATVTLTQGGTTVATTTTNSSGVYQFINVQEGSGYVINVTSTVGNGSISSFTVDNDRNDLDVIVTAGGGGFTLSGTVTNASTGLAQSGATVTLLQNGSPVSGAETTTDNSGNFQITGVQSGSNFTLQVSGAGITTVTTDPFAVSGNITGIDIVVTSSAGGVSVSGTIGTDDDSREFALTLRNSSGATLASTTTGPAQNQVFNFTNVPPGTGYTIAVTGQTGIITIFGPFDVTSAGVSNLSIPAISQNSLINDTTIPEPIPPTNNTATIAAFGNGGTTITINGTTCPNGNPSFLTNIPPGPTTITIRNSANQSVTFTVNLQPNTIYVFRPVFPTT